MKYLLPIGIIILAILYMTRNKTIHEKAKEDIKKLTMKMHSYNKK